jgi:hypothetical protein
MQPYIYSIIHIVGIILTFMGFAYGMKQWSKGAAIAHGTGLTLLLISGFGLIAKKYNNELQTWMFVKLAIWLALGGALVLVKRGIVKGIAAWVLLVGLGAGAAWTVYHGIGLL